MMSDQFLYFAKRPPLEELEAIELVYRAANSTVPLLRMKCRELARADGNCVVTPVHGTNDNTAWAVAKIGYLRECGTQQKLSQLGFEVTSRNHVTIEILQRCYEFSVTARMGPKWNRIGEHLVQGCEFFTTGKTYHVGVDINITATELVVALKAGQIKFSFLKPEDLNAAASLLRQYKSGVTRVLTETSFEDRGCILLPNCTRGAVYSVSPTVPASQQFATYNSIRIHWKKHHGFVLPDQQRTFYQIYFTFKPSQLLSYPGCCVLQYPPVTYKCKDPAVICASFVDCLHSRIPSLCGYPIHYTAKPLQPSVGLSTALHCQKFINLLHVGKKSASTGTVKDFSSTIDDSASTSAVKPDHAYKPIFHPSLVSRRIVDERRPIVIHTPTQHEPPQRSLPAPCIASSRQAAEQASSVSRTVSSVVTLSNKMIATSSCLHKGNSSDTRMLHDVTNMDSSLIAQISRQKVATLKKWLVMNDVKFRVKGTKRDDLIKLVAMHIKDVKELLVMSSEE